MKSSAHGGDWAAFLEETGALPLDFSASISPLGLPDGVKRAAAGALQFSGRYPDPHCRALRRALSEKTGIPAEKIVCGNGAADLIYRLPAALHAARALLPVPAFSEYASALALGGCALERVPFRPEDDFALPEAFVCALHPQLDLVLLCQPNNPTGRLIPPELLQKILRRCREMDIALVVDECFLPLTDDPSRHSLLQELHSGGRLILLRAFTKLYAMAGLRLGAALCSSVSLAEALERAGQPWAVSTVAQAAGEAALREDAYVQKLRALIRRERESMKSELAALGFKVVPGEANFLLFFCGRPMLAEALRRRGILLRDCRNFDGLGPGWYRTAIRTPEENALLLEALRDFLKEQGD